MIFSVQNSNLLYAVKFSPDLVQIQVRETLSRVFLARMDIPIQFWHMVEVIRRDFKEHHIMQVPMTENQLGEMQMTEEVDEHVGMKFLKECSFFLRKSAKSTAEKIYIYFISSKNLSSIHFTNMRRSLR